jgi:hypothetical protein
MAGRNRAEVRLVGAHIWINVAARAYALPYGLFIEPLPSDVDDATVQREEGSEVLNLDFEMSGSLVSVGGQDVTEDELRRFARSLRRHDYDEWRENLASGCSERRRASRRVYPSHISSISGRSSGEGRPIGRASNASTNSAAAIAWDSVETSGSLTVSTVEKESDLSMA